MATSLRPRPRTRRQQGRAFYTTALIVSLFACYSLIRSFARDDPPARIARRSFHIQDEECRLVHHAHDKCAFVRANCPDEEAGLISYLQLYYCSLPNAKPVGFIILLVWISLLFGTIGIAASDFLCVNLSTIAAILGMSESLTGVTFLAFGNGSPDVFSTFAAMSTGSGSLAVGELLGAAGFISAVVAGSMAITNPFQVARKSFIRDVGFFAVSASFSLVFLSDGSLRLWECIVMIAFYVFYVIFVVTWHWYLTQRRRKRQAENAARLQHHIPDTQELEVPAIDLDDDETQPASERERLVRGSTNDSVPTLLRPGTPVWKLDDEDDDETRARYLAELSSNMRVNRGGRRNTMTPIRPSLIGALEFRSVLSSLEKKSTNQNIGLRRYSEDAVNLLSHAETSVSQPSLLVDGLESDDDVDKGLSHSGRGRAVSANDAPGLRIDTSLLAAPDDETAVSTATTPDYDKPSRPSASFLRGLDELDSGKSPSPMLTASPTGSIHSDHGSLGHSRNRSSGFLAPPSNRFHSPIYDDEQHRQSRSPVLSPRAHPTLHVPILHTPHPDHHKSPLSHEFPTYHDSPATTPRSGRSRAPSIRLPAPSLSPESTHGIVILEGEEEEQRIFKWWPYRYLVAPQIILSMLFPTLYGWRSRSLPDKMLGLVTAPSVFVLTITLPIVESGNDEDDVPDPDSDLLTPGEPIHENPQLIPDISQVSNKHSDTEVTSHPHGGISRQQSDYQKQPTSPATPTSSPKDWNRWLVFLQVFTAPLFTTFIIWANASESHSVLLLIRLALGSLIFSLILIAILLLTTTHTKEPKYRPLFCFLGFLVAIAWISTIANEVVGVLKAFGVIFNISDAILGLTIFAVGNSLGDLVADITVAKLGYPVMALSACFGGPMLNILLGIGVSGAYMTIRHGEDKHKQHPNRPIRFKPYELEISTTLIISGVTLLVTLLGLLLVVPLNGWRMDRKIGWGLIALWCLSTVANLVVEVLGYGDAWEDFEDGR